MSARNRANHEELPRLYRPADVAESLGCSEWWVKEQARRRRIPFVKSGGSYRFTKDHFEEIVLIFEERPDDASKPVSSSARAHRAEPLSTVPVVRLRARRPRRTRNVA